MSEHGIQYIAGVDEVGRGALAGPVVVCAVFAPCDFSFSLFPFLADSKKVSPARRVEIYKRAVSLKKSGALSFSVGRVGAPTIDRGGMGSALRVATARALTRAPRNKKVLVLLDGGLRAPHPFLQKTIVRGDESVPIISLASVIAKVVRDRYMERLSLSTPGYGFEIHKGYGTACHRETIALRGPSSVHRLSFLSRIINEGMVY